MASKSIDATSSGYHTRNISNLKSLRRVTLLPELQRDAKTSTFGKAKKGIDITMYNCPQHVKLGLMK
jgi:hypothetical protein